MYVFICIYVSTYVIVFTQDFPPEIYSNRYTHHWASQVVLVVKNLLDNAGDVRDVEFIPWVREDPLEKGITPTPVFLPGELHGQRSLAGYSPGVAKGWTQLSDLAHTHKHHWASLHLYAPELNIFKFELNICCKTPPPAIPAQRLMT